MRGVGVGVLFLVACDPGLVGAPDAVVGQVDVPQLVVDADVQEPVSLAACAAEGGVLVEVDVFDPGLGGLYVAAPGRAGELAVVSADGVLAKLAASGEVTHSLQLEVLPGSLQVADNAIVAVDHANTVTHWEPGGDLVQTAEAPSGTVAMGFADGTFAAATYDWEYPHHVGSLSETAAHPSQLSGTTAVTVLARQGVVAFGGSIGYSLPAVELRDLDDPSVVVGEWPTDWFRCGASSSVVDMVADTRGSRLAVISGEYGDGHIAVLDLADASPIGEAWAYGHYATNVVWLDEQTLLSAGWEGTLRTWDAASLEQLSEHPTAAWTTLSMAVDRAAQRVTTVGSDGLVRSHACELPG
jgi:hypothetical protein